MMRKRSPFILVLVCLLSSFLFLSACSSNQSHSEEKADKKEEDAYAKLAEEKNNELELEPLELTSYSEEVGATIKEPAYKEFAVNGKVVVEGMIEKHSEIKGDFIWIKVLSAEEGPAGNQHEYYTKLENGKFKQEVRFFNGEGEYRVMVQVPSKDSENYYYDTASFTVHNVNPKMERDVTYSPFGQEAGISLDFEQSYHVKQEAFTVSGDAGNLTDQDTLMLRLVKESESWQHILPIEDGKFTYAIPLFFGKGVHELEILVPDQNRENYYQLATKILIDNESNRTMEPIEYSRTYQERGVTLESPRFGGERSEGLYEVKGEIDPAAEFGPETTHIYVTTKKGEDEALDVIPVEDFTFDGSFYLRFGPGTYEVILSVPEIKEKNSDRFRYFGFAKFEVEATSNDQRDLLPSRGVESDAPEIITLSKKLTNGMNSDKEKAKAIYDYVTKNVTYDVGKYENKEYRWDDSAIRTLELKSGVCQDYSYLAVALLRASNMEARIIEGTAFGGFWPSNHAWVEAKVNGEWLTMDPTWGAGFIEDDQFVAKYNPEYFDPNKAEFEKTHMRKGVLY
ncbi:transglutaminase-like domain-containing protein [Cytobacillus spongiae]|uniref:transglutaminase domain-containing protein n=1 Tax=Cytobacillus spongiae TaxID=2901381 RepID=UPI001F447435|nr:transglutaminase-like domain-containing protein [Cytobacillus spongiae]UII56262.1 transglutaminase-like domain-containing protein [Cytobacillus spongiae]